MITTKDIESLGFHKNKRSDSRKIVQGYYIQDRPNRRYPSTVLRIELINDIANNKYKYIASLETKQSGFTDVWFKCYAFNSLLELRDIIMRTHRILFINGEYISDIYGIPKPPPPKTHG